MLFIGSFGCDIIKITQNKNPFTFQEVAKHEGGRFESEGETEQDQQEEVRHPSSSHSSFAAAANSRRNRIQRAQVGVFFLNINLSVF